MAARQPVVALDGGEQLEAGRGPRNTATATAGSAICDGAVSAAWQHRKRSASVSSCAREPGFDSVALAGASGSAMRTSPASLGDIAAELVDEPPRGGGHGPRPRILGDPSTDHCTMAARSASWTASSHASKCAWWRTRLATTPGASGRRRCSLGGNVRAEHEDVEAGPRPAVVAERGLEGVTAHEHRLARLLELGEP
jgi:hypothetical protein